MAKGQAARHPGRCAAHDREGPAGPLRYAGEDLAGRLGYPAAPAPSVPLPCSAEGGDWRVREARLALPPLVLAALALRFVCDRFPVERAVEADPLEPALGELLARLREAVPRLLADVFRSAIRSLLPSVRRSCAGGYPAPPAYPFFAASLAVSLTCRTLRATLLSLCPSLSACSAAPLTLAAVLCV